MITDGRVLFVKNRVNVRCAACRWYTSRAPKADDDYGRCYWCSRTLTPVRLRHYFSSHASPPAAAVPAPTRYREQGATWPELVAAELQRREDEGRKDLEQL